MSTEGSDPQTTPRTVAGEALDAAIEAWNSHTSWDYSADGLEAACWAFHEHMLKQGVVSDV